MYILCKPDTYTAECLIKTVKIQVSKVTIWGLIHDLTTRLTIATSKYWGNNMFSNSSRKYDITSWLHILEKNSEKHEICGKENLQNSVIYRLFIHGWYGILAN